MTTFHQPSSAFFLQAAMQFKVPAPPDVAPDGRLLGAVPKRLGRLGPVGSPVPHEKRQKS
jgi:hypothetical protein